MLKVRKRRAGLITLVASTAVAAALIAFAVVGGGAQAQTAPVGSSSAASATAQVSGACGSASQQVQAGTASGFMQWVNQKCNSEGVGALVRSANNNAAPLGALICQYARGQVEQGADTSLNRTQLSLCNQKPVPEESGIISKPSLPAGIPITVTNAWVGTVNNEREVVYAGSQRFSSTGAAGNPQQGALYVIDSATGLSHTYLSTGLGGALTIESATGTTLTLSATGGASYSFNAAGNTLTKVG